MALVYALLWVTDFLVAQHSLSLAQLEAER